MLREPLHVLSRLGDLWARPLLVFELLVRVRTEEKVFDDDDCHRPRRRFLVVVVKLRIFDPDLLSFLPCFFISLLLIRTPPRSPSSNNNQTASTRSAPSAPPPPAPSPGPSSSSRSRLFLASSPLGSTMSRSSAASPRAPRPPPPARPTPRRLHAASRSALPSTAPRGKCSRSSRRSPASRRSGSAPGAGCRCGRGFRSGGPRSRTFVRGCGAHRARCARRRGRWSCAG